MSAPFAPTAAHETLALRQTNVSNPSVIHSRPSQQSFAASDDYYSFSASSNSSTRSAELPHDSRSQQTITRYQTPPSRYRTPQQSRDLLPLPQQQQQQQQQQRPQQPQLPQQHQQSLPPPQPPQPQHVDEQSEEQSRKTPMRGPGKRRQSATSESSVAGIATTAAAAAAEPLLAESSQQAQRRDGGLRRKPVPSRDMEQDRNSRVSATHARSSVYRDMDRQRDAPTPGVDDTPFLHFALDQLTRDEEVRGSRAYPGIAPGIDGEYPYQIPQNIPRSSAPGPVPVPVHSSPPRQQTRYERVPQQEDGEEERDIVEQAPYSDVLPPPRNPDRLSSSPRPPYPQGLQQQQQGPNVFIPVPEAELQRPRLKFVPGVLRPLQLGLYICFVLAYLVCLIIAAAWSVSNTGLWAYGSLGDGRYFLFQYLPTLLGMILLVWLFEIQKALYRIAPFVAIASPLPSRRIVGGRLPMQPRGFLLPYFGHFEARQTIVGVFLLVAWLQLFTIPLLGSSFNVYQENGRWIWIATQGAIWPVVALYIFLLAALVALLVWLMRTTTGLKWDPRSLADLVVLVERSNALDGLGDGVPQLGYFRTTHRPSEVFHTYGIAEKPARSYGVVDGQIREKRYSDPGDMDLETGQPSRFSGEKMLPRAGTDDILNGGTDGAALPWFLRPSLAALWPIVSIVLLLAFLIVSYLPSTRVSQGFDPMVSPNVNQMGFSSTNFLYGFLPTLLAMLCMLFWLEFDLVYRRLTPFESLAGVRSGRHQHGNEEEGGPMAAVGDTAERTLLSSYPADLALALPLTALANAHLRLAFLGTVTLLTFALPVLASGIFWTQFYIPTQRTLIFAHLPAYYALTVLLTIFALAFLALFPSRTLRSAPLPRPHHLDTFRGICDLLHQSRLLDDLAFRGPASRAALVARLLSSSSSANAPAPTLLSKISFADSLRGFGRARATNSPPYYAGYQSHFAFGRAQGRDGREVLGIDRVRQR